MKSSSPKKQRAAEGGGEQPELWETGARISYPPQSSVSYPQETETGKHDDPLDEDAAPMAEADLESRKKPPSEVSLEMATLAGEVAKPPWEVDGIIAAGSEASGTGGIPFPVCGNGPSALVPVFHQPSTSQPSTTIGGSDPQTMLTELPEAGEAAASAGEALAGLSRLDEPMPSRMLNEFVYCSRLFYYEYVEGTFVENADTERGSALHVKVDNGRGDLPAARKAKGNPQGGKDSTSGLEDREPREADGGAGANVPGDSTTREGREISAEAAGLIHSRSAMLGSQRLGVVAKMDLIEATVSLVAGGVHADREVLRVTPVDYKAGAPRKGKDANELWDTDQMQLGLQILILRDNGYVCEDGMIYYRATKQRVRLEMTPELERWIIGKISEARRTAVGPMPPPLMASPKCVRCSLAPVCLPDETRLLTGRLSTAAGMDNRETDPATLPQVDGGPPGGVALPVRRLMAARDDARALYLNTPGLRVGIRDEVLVVKEGDRVVQEVRTGDVTHVALFGNIQISTQAVQVLCDKEIPVGYFSMGGWFYGLTRGHGMTNVFTRIEQFRQAADPLRCLALARRMVQGKIRNQRTLLMRLHVEAPPPVLARLKQAAQDVLRAGNLQELLGMEGAAAALYFQNFSGMIKVESGDMDELPGLEDPTRAPDPPVFTFDFVRRTRRPPTDPVNALLSLAYSLLAKDCTIAAPAVGLDPYVGFYHQPRYGRPALALDLMEEFRPLIAESTVLTAINNRMLRSNHFVKAGDAVNLTPAGRKIFFQAYEQRMNALITHPIFDYRVSYRRVLELQTRLLARHLIGEIPDYIPMVTR
jgi:CRISPR-associated protein Cas1